MNIRDAYTDIVSKQGLLPDDAQLRVVKVLQKLQLELQARVSPWQALLARTGLGPARKPVRGLYLWGGVGGGKTFLMDLFFEHLDVADKRRIHFHRIMREVHQRIKQLGDTEDPLDKVAADIAAETRVLCFDEFYVSDIADAMILGRLLQCLFSRGVTLVATSNAAPTALYPDGLQRERFLPAIESLQRYTNVLELDAGLDYRFRLLQQAGTYLSPAGEAADEKLLAFFKGVAHGDVVKDGDVEILGRDIRAKYCAKGVAWFEFSQICDGPRSQNDYIEIARWYQTVIVSSVPVLDRNLENPARRFIAMVDEFYDRRVNLILSAAVSIDQLYQGSQLEFEFQRTVSRLTEMQSAEYLREAHLA